MSPWRSRVGSSANGDGKHPSGDGTSSAALLPTALVGVFFKALFGVTVGLYILNQKHMLPKPLSRIVSKALFWPTMPITVVKRLGSWTTPIDDTVIMGGIPFGFVGFPEHLYEEGVSISQLSFTFSGAGSSILPTSHSLTSSIQYITLTIAHFSVLGPRMIQGPWCDQFL